MRPNKETKRTTRNTSQGCTLFARSFARTHLVQPRQLPVFAFFVQYHCPALVDTQWGTTRPSSSSSSSCSSSCSSSFPSSSSSCSPPWSASEYSSGRRDYFRRRRLELHAGVPLQRPQREHVEHTRECHFSAEERKRAVTATATATATTNTRRGGLPLSLRQPLLLLLLGDERRHRAPRTRRDRLEPPDLDPPRQVHGLRETLPHARDLPDRQRPRRWQR